MFVIAMHQPGVTVRPLVDMTGRAPFNEVYLDEARVGPDGVIGEVWAEAALPARTMSGASSEGR